MFGLRIDRQSRVIIAAYAVFCAGLLLTSLFVTRQVRLILSSAESLYVHPFTVSNQALEARLTLMSIRRDLLFAVLSRNAMEIRRVQDRLVVQDAGVEEALRQVRGFYLGDRAEVERVGQLYAAWKSVRNTILDAARRGDFDRAEALVLSSGTPMYNEIDDELNKVISFARNRAALFLQEARAQRDRAERVVYLVILVGFAASFLCSAIVIRYLRQVARGHEEALERLAHHDSLTGLPNRQLFLDRFRQALLLAEREGKQTALLYVDLDRFKEVNDTFGHEAGDQLLVQVSAGFAAAVRRSDTVARLGGDEFVVMLPDARDQETLREVAEKLMKVAAAPCPFRGRNLEVSASVGIAVFPADGRDVETLLARADAAMYRAKRAGPNQLRFSAEGETA